MWVFVWELGELENVNGACVGLVAVIHAANGRNEASREVEGNHGENLSNPDKAELVANREGLAVFSDELGCAYFHVGSVTH